MFDYVENCWLIIYKMTNLWGENIWKNLL
jgi:hypothetical protein